MNKATDFNKICNDRTDGKNLNSTDTGFLNTCFAQKIEWDNICTFVGNKTNAMSLFCHLLTTF